MYSPAMKRQDMIKMVGAAALGHAVAPPSAGAVPVLPEGRSPKLFRLIGEHVQAWCSASSLEDAERLFQENLDPLELSATSLDEVTEDEWEHHGIRKAPGNTTTPFTGEARLLACNRGEFH
jgi:hypothetical protein